MVSSTLLESTHALTGRTPKVLKYQTNSHLVQNVADAATSPANTFGGFDLSTFEPMLGGGRAGGGIPCAACTILLTLLEQYSDIHEQSIDKSMQEVCKFFPDKISPICTYLVEKYGDEVIQYFMLYKHSDEVCHAMNICTVQSCRLFNNVTSVFNGPYKPRPALEQIEMQRFDENPWDWIKNLFNRFGNDHVPLEDIDGDKYSLDSTLRGYSWRGKDCDDIDRDVYPGTIGDTHNGLIDWNCNGIKGVNDKGVAWEEELCGTSGQLGIILVGDSVGAHFSIPPQWLTAADINSTTYQGMVGILENELDWPHKSAITAWASNTTESGPIDSVYHRLRERNLCNHRDYQNTGVNGARSGNVADGNILGVARNQEKDHPVILFYELVGNDVCSGHHDLDHMTTPAEFANNTLRTLEYLDTILPMGSHIVFTGLADGRILWDTLWNRTHPIGASYEQVYDFLNCLEASPCWGWMNSNETVRDLTTARAVELSAVYPEIIKNYTYTHFDMQYYEFPFPEINAIWTAEGGQTWQLIEPCDGFHPNQIANYLMSGVYWNWLMEDHPEWLGDINPNNDLIASMFGDQGGYN
ncbi:hypothetical protein SAMD00019534_036770 [Acytostelium subglobosum LB1]|uniref:hypothetical protein n=1 Tax=Acytostelium subglobosum LB1 TaxID=1410327 RepID=UPI000644826F|nr:hypothetical protein SAMD00019534_036770 [Acytostelium subglobosum LB1]GAM20502.1 hypothetical protein SAMD00019534_036770 [Acytostelium subglobosum LB1]|eukprot:XP_012760023.1 hypothetical protein SAMD00019534_036770 [Acytostelium subglobosum LB1]